jgi:hypothetical protein
MLIESGFDAFLVANGEISLQGGSATSLNSHSALAMNFAVCLAICA